MTHLVSSEVTKARIAKWISQAKPIDEVETWTEHRMVIEFGGHLYPVVQGQVFQCGRCGHYDPEWSATEVLQFFEETFGIKPYEVEVTVAVKR